MGNPRDLDPAVPGLVVELVDRVLTVTLDDQERHNALTGAMMNGLRSVMAAASISDDVRVVVIRGAGERAFASGADIGEQANAATSLDGGNTAAIPAANVGLVEDLLACSRPVIAMIHGWCLGGGLMVALTADIRIASADAVFSIPAARLGVGYPTEAVRILVEICGKGVAAELMLTGERIDAETAARVGLVNRVVASSELEATTAALAATLAANAPLAVSLAKAQIAYAVEAARAVPEGLQSQLTEVWQSDDAAEGMAAFSEKRLPAFKGSSGAESSSYPDAP